MADGGADRPVPGVAALLRIGVVCGVSIGLGALVGLLLDDALGTSPLLVLLGLAVGIVGAATGSYYVIRPYVADAPKGASKPKE
jgi:F0F1-type ATP synthase assembly protein I